LARLAMVSLRRGDREVFVQQGWFAAPLPTVEIESGGHPQTPGKGASPPLHSPFFSALPMA
jgi:hypothetical protein